MSITVSSDILGGKMGYGADGYYATRLFHVEFSQNMGTKETRPWMAINSPGIPARGSLHPAVGIPVDDIRAEPLPGSSAKFLVTVTYKAPQPGGDDLEVGQEPQITVSSRVQEIESHFDALGKQITTKHISEGDEIPATVTLSVPVMTVRYRRRELASASLDPREYVGKVNSDESFVGGVRSWLCTELEKETTDGGATYIVSYGFQWKAPYSLKWADGSPIVNDVPGWDAYVIEYDNEGNPVQNPTLGEGLKTVQVYKSTSFEPMQLTYEYA